MWPDRGLNQRFLENLVCQSGLCLLLLIHNRIKWRVREFLGTAYKISRAPTLGVAVFVLVSIRQASASDLFILHFPKEVFPITTIRIAILLHNLKKFTPDFTNLKCLFFWLVLVELWFVLYCCLSDEKIHIYRKTYKGSIIYGYVCLNLHNFNFLLQ